LHIFLNNKNIISCKIVDYNIFTSKLVLLRIILFSFSCGQNFSHH